MQDPCHLRSAVAFSSGGCRTIKPLEKGMLWNQTFFRFGACLPMRGNMHRSRPSLRRLPLNAPQRVDLAVAQASHLDSLLVPLGPGGAASCKLTGIIPPGSAETRRLPGDLPAWSASRSSSTRSEGRHTICRCIRRSGALQNIEG